MSAELASCIPVGACLKVSVTLCNTVASLPRCIAAHEDHPATEYCSALFQKLLGTMPGMRYAISPQILLRATATGACAPVYNEVSLL